MRPTIGYGHSARFDVGASSQPMAALVGALDRGVCRGELGDRSELHHARADGK
ncbi:MAG: hypothetical protein K2W85_00230 [Phycisphaerales bacterium]|nr:hypothetical protein [Phycisphaerales bacterium]